MNTQLEEYREAALTGDYEAALAYNKYARKKRQAFAEWESALMLGLETEAANIWYDHFQRNKDDVCAQMTEMLGFSFDRSQFEGIEEDRKAANGRRRASILQPSEIFATIVQAARSERGWAYQGSYATAAGTTVCLVVKTNKTLVVSVKHGHSITIEPDDFEEGYRDYWEVYHYSPMPDAVYGKSFTDWNNMSEEQQTTVTHKWGKRVKSARTFECIEENPVLPLIPQPSPLSDLLPEGQHRRYIDVANHIDKSHPDNGWYGVAERLLQWPKGVMDDIELTMLDRHLADWPAVSRSITPCVQARYWHNIAPLSRLARSLHLNDQMRAFVRRESPHQDELDFSHITDLIMPDNWAIRIYTEWKTWPALPALNTIRMPHYDDDEHYEMLLAWPYWEQVTNLVFNGEEYDKFIPEFSNQITDKCTQLKDLTLRKYKLHKKNTKTLVLPAKLDTLVLDHTPINAGTHATFAAGFPKECDTLVLHKSNYKHLGLLASEDASPVIRHLRIEHHPKRDANDCFDNLTGSPLLASLQSLTLIGNKVSTDRVMQLCTSELFDSLEHLEIEGQKLTEQDAETLWKHWKPKGLTSLRVDGWGFHA